MVWIQIDKLKRRPRQIVIDEQEAGFSALQDLIGQGDVTFDENIRGILNATWVGQIIEVTGHLTTMVTLPCSRCLLPVTCNVDVPIVLSYAGCDDVEDLPLAEEVELQSEELGLIPFSGTEIDLRPDLAQEIIMALPQQPLCQKTCQGLCPICGSNFNLNSCDCEPPVFHAGLAALKNFKTKQ